MLVLSRKSNEKIQIGDNISITILQTKGNRVRIGIEAPPETRVLRGELFAAEIMHSTDETVSQNDEESVVTNSESNREKQADSNQIADLHLFDEKDGPKSGISNADPAGLSFVPMRNDALKKMANKKQAERNLNRNGGATNRLLQILEESRQQDILPLDNRF